MPDKVIAEIARDPTTWSLGTWGLPLAISCLGGLVTWLDNVRKGHSRAFNIAEFVGEIVTAAFVGMLAYIALRSYGQTEGISAAASGVCAHMGTRALFLIEFWLEQRIRKLIGAKPREST